MLGMQSSICTNTLLSLYSRIDDSKTRWPTEKRNAYIRAYLKQTLRRHPERSLKKLLQSTKNKLETNLEKELDVMSARLASDSDYARMMTLHEKVATQLGCATSIAHCGQRVHQDTVTLLKVELDHRFSDLGKQTGAVSFLLMGKRFHQLYDTLRESCPEAVLHTHQINSESKRAHIMLLLPTQAF